MSSWVENQQQEAFALYRRYIGVGLHFRDGADYDYTLYNGATRLTLSAFLKKPKPEILRFIKLSNRLKAKAVSHEEFLFANARHDNTDIFHLSEPEAMNTYRGWKDRYGDAETFLETVSGQLRTFLAAHPKEASSGDLRDVASALLLAGDDYIEVTAWMLQNNQEIVTDVRVAAEENIFKKMMLTKVIRCQKFYSYLCLI